MYGTHAANLVCGHYRTLSAYLPYSLPYMINFFFAKSSGRLRIIYFACLLACLITYVSLCSYSCQQSQSFIHSSSRLGMCYPTSNLTTYPDASK